MQGRSIEEILGPLDSSKFRSFLTLFAYAAFANRPFKAALDKYFESKPDPHNDRSTTMPAVVARLRHRTTWRLRIVLPVSS
ncbi:MAG TPA: DUF1810 family protein [Terriglobia bacterium]|nr:DUF1810 family protein [Terriglobia bacterium]